MTEEEIKTILQEAKTIAVVGMSKNHSKPSFKVAAYLRNHGYHIIPVNPTADSILGLKSYPDLLSIPEKIDVVDIFRESSDVLPVVLQAVEKKAEVVWMQRGIINEEAAELAKQNNIKVVMDNCMMAEHIKLIRNKGGINFMEENIPAGKLDLETKPTQLLEEELPAVEETKATQLLEEEPLLETKPTQLLEEKETKPTQLLEEKVEEEPKEEKQEELLPEVKEETVTAEVPLAEKEAPPPLTDWQKEQLKIKTDYVQEQEKVMDAYRKEHQKIEEEYRKEHSRA